MSLSRCFIILCKVFDINPIQDGPFRGCSWIWAWGGVGLGNRSPLAKMGHAYRTMMKLDTFIPYLGKIQKTYKSRDTPLEFLWHQNFFTGNQKILLYQQIQIYWNKGSDVIIFVHDVINRILSLVPNYIVDVVMRPKFGNCSTSMREVVTTSVLKNHFLWGVILVQVYLHQRIKKVKTKSQKVLGD